MSEPSIGREPALAAGSRTEPPLAYRLVRGSLWVAASSYLTLGVGFLINVALVRLLAPDDFGIVALATFFFFLVTLRQKLGIGPGVMRQQELTGKLLGTFCLLEVGSAGLTIGLAVAAGLLLPVFGYPEELAWALIVLSVAELIEALASPPFLLLQRDLQLARISAITTAAFVLSYVPVVSLALAGAGYLSLLAQPVTAGLLGLVPAWLSVRALLPDVFRLRWQFDRQTARELIGFGLPLGASGFATSIVERFDNFLIGTFVGTTTLGFYDRAYRLARWPTLLVTDVVNRGVVATYARLQDDRERLEKTVRMTIWVITTGALPVVIGLFVAGQDLVVWLFGERWLPSVPFLRILLAFAVILPIIDAAHWLLVAIGRSGQAATVRIIQAVALVVTGFALTLPFGAVGTAAAVGIAYVVGLAVTLGFVSREVPVSPVAWFGAPLVAAGLTVGAYLLLSRTFDLNQVPLWARVFLKPSLAGAAYLLLLVALQPRTTIERGRYVLRLARGAG